MLELSINKANNGLLNSFNKPNHGLVSSCGSNLFTPGLASSSSSLSGSSYLQISTLTSQDCSRHGRTTCEPTILSKAYGMRPAPLTHLEGNSVKTRIHSESVVPLTVNGSYSPEHMSLETKRITPICSNPPAERFEKFEVDASLLDYLVRHGALSEEACKRILSCAVSERRLLLLEALGFPSFDESECPWGSSFPTPTSNTGFALLLNALRHTGHHSVASFLDCGRRITPSPCTKPYNETDQGDLCDPNQRRRGQLSIWIQLNSIKVNPTVFEELDKTSLTPSCVQPHSNQNTPSTTALSYEMKQVNSNAMLPSFVAFLNTDNSYRMPTSDIPAYPSASVWIDHSSRKPVVDSATQCSRAFNASAPHKHVDQATHPFTCCFPKLRHFFILRKKRKPQNILKTPTQFQEPPANSVAPNHNVSARFVAPSKLSVDDTVDSTKSHEKNVLVSAKLALLDAKSSDFYNILLDCDSRVHDSMVRYFEQTCGVLVLDSRLSSNLDTGRTGFNAAALCLTVVATRAELIKRLSEASQPIPPCLSSSHEEPLIRVSKLADTLSRAIIEAGILTSLQLQDLRLSVILDPQEVCLATQELSDWIT